MKTCKHCNIKIGGNLHRCPFCQGTLSGQGENNYFPKHSALKTASAFAKVMLFIVMALLVVAVFWDYSFMTVPHKHFSNLVAAYVIILVPAAGLYIKSHKSIPRLLLRTAIIVSVLMFITQRFFGTTSVFSNYVIPGIFMGTLILNFVFCFIDAGFTEDSMFCILVNLFIGILPNLIMMFTGRDVSLIWKLTFMLSIITFAGIIIFKGRLFWLEVSKRLNL